MQGQLWGEVVHTPEQLNELIYPRLLALAERAWHRAPWEQATDTTEGLEDQQLDWQSFANAVGYKELARMGQMGATYWIPPPGAM